MTGIVFKAFALAVLALSVLYMAAAAFRRARRLDARIRAFRREQEELARQGKSQDPYAALAEVYAEVDRESRRPARKRR
jgi:hypothetical protein